MSTAKLGSIVDYCNRELAVAGFPDYKGACNGLQVENRGTVLKVAAAVDASIATVQKAAAAGATLLVVHHGLFWNTSHPWTGRRYELIRFLMDHDIAIYSSHLPLDAHPELGNNALFARALGFTKCRPFYPFEGREIGMRVNARVPLQELAGRVGKVLNRLPVVVPGGPALCSRIGIITGGAGSEIARIAGLGVDTLITGEGPHWSYALGEDLGVNILYGGHYATETFGVIALARAISKKFRIPWEFIDHPTGL